MSSSNSSVRSTLQKVLTIATVLCTARLVSSSVRNVALSEEKLRLSERGLLKYSALSEGEKEQLFRKFERQCGRMYSSTTERSQKYETFKKTLIEIDLSNVKERLTNGSTVFGVTIMTDLSEEEFVATYLSSKIPDSFNSSRRLTQIAPEVAHTTETDYADWRGIYTTPIKYQGGCGSCWAFSAIAQIESDAILAGYLTPDSILSAQQMVKCTYDYDGCLGGFSQTGYEYVAKAGGITYEDYYPYDVQTSYCDKSKNDYAVTVTMSYRVEGEEAMIKQVLSGRTLSISLDAHDIGQYKSGIYAGCSTDYNVNHGMNIVGVNVAGGYWILRNSWGTWWGDNGYMKMALGSNMCGVNNYATYTDTALPAGVSTSRALPTRRPTKSPSVIIAPIAANVVKNLPTANPVSRPSNTPTSPPTNKPVSPPSNTPTSPPTNKPTSPPTNKPFSPPTNNPVSPPSNTPTSPPTNKPISPPTNTPTSPPTNKPTSPPTNKPFSPPTNTPTYPPTNKPISPPTFYPLSLPTNKPVSAPTNKPVSAPTNKPVSSPTAYPVASKTAVLVSSPSGMPVAAPVYNPTTKPITPTVPSIYKPSYRPSRRTRRPTRTGGNRVIQITWPTK